MPHFTPASVSDLLHRPTRHTHSSIDADRVRQQFTHIASCIIKSSSRCIATVVATLTVNGRINLPSMSTHFLPIPYPQNYRKFHIFRRASVPNESLRYSWLTLQLEDLINLITDGHICNYNIVVSRNEDFLLGYPSTENRRDNEVDVIPTFSTDIDRALL